jgi:hypothetical protein
VPRPDGYAPTMDGKIKAPPSAGRMWLFGVEIFGVWHTGPAGAFARNTKIFNAPSAISVIGEGTLSNDHAGR